MAYMFYSIALKQAQQSGFVRLVRHLDVHCEQSAHRSDVILPYQELCLVT